MSAWLPLATSILSVSGAGGALRSMFTDCVDETSGEPLLSVSSSTHTVCVYISPVIVQSGFVNPLVKLASGSLPRFGCALIVRASVSMKRWAAESWREAGAVLVDRRWQRPPRRLMSLHDVPSQTSSVPLVDTVESLAMPDW